MSYLINNEQKINDIIFASRNKNYGAYSIRASYGNTVVKSLSIMAFGFISLMGSAYYYSHRNNNETKMEIVTISDSLITTVVKIDEPKELKTEPRQPEVAVLKQKTTIDVASSTTIVDSLATASKSIATTVVTIGGATSSVTSTEGGSITSTSTLTIASNSPTTGGGNEAHQNFQVDSNPEFEGGLDALYRFVGSKLKYPINASENNKQGTVFVKFVVDENGKIGNLKLLNSAGYGMDEEALRVVSLIPNFKTPAKIKGVPVKVYYQLPIKYKMRF